MKKFNWSARFATQEDCEKLAFLEKQCNPKGAWTQKHFESELLKKNSKILIFTDDETDEHIASYCVYSEGVQGGEERIAEIFLLGVGEDYRKKGFAQVLVRKVIQECLRLKIQNIMLDVRKSNHAAIALYQKLFFTIVSIRKSFYSDGEDAYEMQLDLKNTENNALF